MFLPLIAHPADVGNWVRVVPALAGREASQSIRRTGWSLAQDDRVVRHQHIESVSGFYAEIAPCLARNDDLVLGADLDA